MELSSRWPCQMEESTFINQYLDEFIPEQQLLAAFEEDFQHHNQTFCSTLELEGSQACFEQLTTSNSWNSCTTENSSTPEASPPPPPPPPPPPKMLSFGSSNSHTSHQQCYGSSVGVVKRKDKVTSSGNKRACTQSSKSTSATQDHVLAEKKRREKLSQGFVALSAVVPGIKKMDKASVLGDSIKYLKQLKQRVNTLEEQTAKKTVESVVFVKKVRIHLEDDSTSTEENILNCSNEALPEIEARVSDKNVLIRIQCEKRKGVLVKTLAEIEKLNLSVVNSSVIPFGTSTLDITVMAQMDEAFDMKVKDLVKILRSSFLQFM